LFVVPQDKEGMKNSKSFFVTALLMVVGLALGVWYVRNRSIQAGNGLASTHFSDPVEGDNSGTNPFDHAQLPTIVPNNLPVVTAFLGDLHVKGNPQSDGTLEPFVVGESLKLEVDALNAVEYRWTLNGEVLKEKDQEWSKRVDRFYDVVKPGPHVFTVQVRGANQALVSQEKKAELNILPLKIMRLTKAIVHDDDEHFITGETITLEVEMASSMRADLDFYQYRYFVNDMPVKHPDEDAEWSSNDTFTYTFATPGTYTFKVEARRSDEKKAEDSIELPETVVAADAVLLSFDSNPGNEKGVPVGAQVYFSAFPTSRYGKSECRIGVKAINALDFTWIAEETGATWGDPYRTWLPVEPGTYLVRCEIREIGKEAADDAREMVYTVVDGNF
jgi:hypothetical protein